MLEGKKPQLGKKNLLFSCFAASKILPSPVSRVLSCKLSPGGLGGWILLQGKCGGRKEVPSQADEGEMNSSSQNCCGGFILCTGLQGGDRDSCATTVQGMNPAGLTPAPAVPAHLDTGLGTGSSVWRWIHPCTGSALPQIHREHQGNVLAAKGGSVRQQNRSPSTDNGTTELEFNSKRP